MLKRIELVIVFALFLTGIVHGQITKGNWLVGGAGSIFAYNEEYNVYSPPGLHTEWKYTEINLSATVGYFLKDRFAAGLRPGIWSIKGHSVSGNITQNQKHFFIGPFIRYYFLNNDRMFNILTDVSYQYGANISSGETGKINNFSAMGGPVLYFNSAVGIEFLFGYKFEKEDLKSNSNYTKKGFTTAIGFQFHLEKGND